MEKDMRDQVACLGNGRFPRIFSSATYPASVVRHLPMSAGRHNAVTLLREDSRSDKGAFIGLLAVIVEEHGTCLLPCRSK